MKNRYQIALIIRWIARIWGTLSLLFLLLMIGAHIFGNQEPEGAGFRSSSELLSFIFFPVCTVIGLLLAWRWDGLGGVITVGAIIGFHIIRPDLLFNLMIDGLAAPGLLFLAYWLLMRVQDTKKSNTLCD